MNEKKETILFRAYYNGFAYIGEAQIECTKGAGITDETGYTDEDEIFAELLEVWNEVVPLTHHLPQNSRQFLLLKISGPRLSSSLLRASDELAFREAAQTFPLC